MAAKSLFTDNISDDLKGTVRRIPDGGMDQFRSVPTTYDKDDKGWVNYDLAWKNPDTGLWTIEAHKSFLDQDHKGMGEKKTIARNVCFFDAVYHCGLSYASRIATGEQRYEDEDDTPSYMDACTAAAQPVDISGVPHPAAYGRILTDGIFEQEQRDLARTSYRIKLPALKPEQEKGLRHDIVNELANISDRVSAAPETALNDLLSSSEAVVALEKTRLSAGALQKKTLGTFSTIKIREFMTDMYVFKQKHGLCQAMAVVTIGAVVCGGVGGAGFALADAAIPLVETGVLTELLLGVSTLPFFEPAIGKISDWQFGRKAKKLEKQLKTLPDSDLKSALSEFLRAAKANRHFIKAANTISKFGYRYKSPLQRAFNEINQGCAILGLSDIQTQQLKEMVAQKKFPKAGYFHKDMRRRAGELEQMFSKAIEVIDSEGVKALEHKPELAADEVLGTAKQKVPQPK